MRSVVHHAHAPPWSPHAKIMVGLLLLLALGLMLWPFRAVAQDNVWQTVQVIAPADVRAGPGDDYQALDDLQMGEYVSLYGCLPDRTWCDVQSSDTRGWVPADALGMAYNGETVIVEQAPVDWGLPLYAFIQADYWYHFYRYRPWYPHPPGPPGPWPHPPPPGPHPPPGPGPGPHPPGPPPNPGPRPPPHPYHPVHPPFHPIR